MFQPNTLNPSLRFRDEPYSTSSGVPSQLFQCVPVRFLRRCCEAFRVQIAGDGTEGAGALPKSRIATGWSPKHDQNPTSLPPKNYHDATKCYHRLVASRRTHVATISGADAKNAAERSPGKVQKTTKCYHRPRRTRRKSRHCNMAGLGIEVPHPLA